MVMTGITTLFCRYLSVECHEEKNPTMKERFKLIRARFLSNLYHVSNLYDVYVTGFAKTCYLYARDTKSLDIFH